MKGLEVGSGRRKKMSMIATWAPQPKRHQPVSSLLPSLVSTVPSVANWNKALSSSTEAYVIFRWPLTRIIAHCSGASSSCLFNMHYAPTISQALAMDGPRSFIRLSAIQCTFIKWWSICVAAINTQSCTQVDVYYVGSSCVWVYKTSKETKCCTFNNISYCLLIQFNWLQFIVLHYLIPLQYVTHLLSIPRTFINT